MKDLLYYFDKTTFVRNELGEIQDSFNMSFVIDGTKDSCKANVYSYIKTKITPKTICYHLGTQTWWIVSNDKVSRFENENGYLYIHELQLEGAIDLLNARDLTDSGFNANRYSVYDFINRLFRLSNFEYDIQINYNNNIASDKTIDYIKTFENYTLLSALREFLDGYNCVAKLSFATKTEDDEILLDYAIIDILSKTGNSNVVSRNSDEVFNDIREITNTNKSNYGTSVISNAENVVSTKTKTYPSIGSGIKLGNNSNVATNGSNAILRLPTNVFKAHYIDIYGTKVPYGYVYNGGKTTISYVDLSNKSSIDNAYNEVISTLHSLYPDFDSSVFTKDLFYKHFIRVYYCDNYNAVSDTFITQNRTAIVRLDQGSPNVEKSLVLCSEELKNSLTYPKQAICFNRGKDYISGFGCFDYQSDTEMRVIYFTKDEVCQEAVYQNYYLYMFVGDIDIDNATGEVSPASNESYEIKYTAYSVNYTPMTDIKIKMDNDGDTIDSDLYNQNGKLNDSNSLSKVLLSYVKEIESDTITKYGTYYGAYVDTLGFQSGGLPNVGDLIKVNNDLYVINNISIDFTPNESTTWLVDSIGYYMVAEVSMSKKVATKSLLTSPNTNIRDYGIPQNNNVKRKQLYRDFYEFTYTKESNKHNWYLPLGKVLNLSNQPQEYKEHIAVIHTIFNDNVNGHKDYYYQLETTTYFLKKSLYEITDFKDNNIIGYGYQNLWSGFDITKILTDYNNLVGLYNTPISYVDNIGEVKDILIKMTSIENLSQVYDDYMEHEGYVDPNTNKPSVSIYNSSVFIPSYIYTNLTTSKYDFLISDKEDYQKDALEVPVFEYSCQVDDTDNILLGENILDRGNNDVAYLYSYILTNNSAYDDNNYMLLKNQIPLITVNANNEAQHNYAVRFDTTHINDNNPYFELSLYDRETIDIDDNSLVDSGTPIDIDNDMTLLVIRHTLTSDDLYTNVVGTLGTGLTTPQASEPTASATYRYKIVVLDDGTYAVCEPDQYTFYLSFDSNSYGYFTLIRDGVYIYNDTLIRASGSLSLTTLQDDIFSWRAEPHDDYYIEGIDEDSDNSVSDNYSHSVVGKHYQTIQFTKNQGVDYVELYVNSVYSKLQANTTIGLKKQSDTYSFTTTFITGWEVDSGGSQITTTIGDNSATDNVLTISPIAKRKTYTITASISGNGSGSITIYYKDPDNLGSGWSHTSLSNGQSVSLKYQASYYWLASADSGSFTSGTASGGSANNPLTLGASNETITTSFGLAKTFTWYAGSNTTISVSITRGNLHYSSGANQSSYSFVLHEGDVWSCTSTANANYYFNGDPTQTTSTISGVSYNDYESSYTAPSASVITHTLQFKPNVVGISITLNWNDPISGSGSETKTVSNLSDGVYWTLHYNTTYSWSSTAGTYQKVLDNGSGSDTLTSNTTKNLLCGEIPSEIRVQASWTWNSTSVCVSIDRPTYYTNNYSNGEVQWYSNIRQYMFSAIKVWRADVYAGTTYINVQASGYSQKTFSKSFPYVIDLDPSQMYYNLSQDEIDELMYLIPE